MLALNTSVEQRSDEEPIAIELSDEERLTICKLVLRNIWEKFSFFAIVSERDNLNMGRRVAPMNKAELLSGEELVRLIENTVDNGIMPEDDIPSRIEKAMALQNQDACQHTLMPFIQLILKQRVRGFLYDEGTRQPTVRSTDFVTRVLQYYIQCCVGKEPPLPRNWTLPTGGCGCGDCNAVNQFLKDPQQRVGRFPLSSSRRAHLHQQFTDARNAPYTVTTLRGTNPNVWEMTKTLGSAGLIHEAWVNRRADAEQWLKLLKKAGPLDSYLGDMEDAILSLDLERIEAEQHQKMMMGHLTSHHRHSHTRHPLQTADVNGQTSTAARRALKRSADSNGQSGSAKRVKSRSTGTAVAQTPKRTAEVIDLTGSP